MKKILKYSIYDVVRSKWVFTYTIFFAIISFSLFYFSNSPVKAIMSLMNVVIIIIPLISMVFGIMYYYSTRDFIELLLTQPVSRSNVFLGQFIGVSLSLSLSFVIGLLLPLVYFGIESTSAFDSLLLLLFTGIALTFIFCAFAFWIALRNENRIKGFGLGILFWLFMTIIYDGIFLLALTIFNDYPLETPTILLTLLNPIDLSRILILLHLQISALLGYNGAVFSKFFGTSGGLVVSILCLLFWAFFPVILIIRTGNKKDF